MKLYCDYVTIMITIWKVFWPEQHKIKVKYIDLPSFHSRMLYAYVSQQDHSEPPVTVIYLVSGVVTGRGDKQVCVCVCVCVHVCVCVCVCAHYMNG